MAVTINLGPKGLTTGLSIGGTSLKPSSGITIGGSVPAASAVPAVPALTPEPKRVVKEEQLDLDFPDHATHSLDGPAILKYHQSLSPLGQDFSPVKSREAGLYFGYPDCCIDNYNAAYDRGERLQYQGAGGFIPCPTCLAKADKDPKGLGSLIVNRVCARPYPNSVAAEDIRVLIEGRPTATMLRILRVYHRIDSDAPLTPDIVAMEEDKVRRMPKKALDVAMEYLQNLKG